MSQLYWLLAKYGTQRDDCYEHIANGLINHVVRVLGALTLIYSRVPNDGIGCFGVHLIGLISMISFYQC